MKRNINTAKSWFAFPALLAICLFVMNGALLAQDTTAVADETAAPAKIKPVKKYFSECMAYRQSNSNGSH
jgi:hypothetical protein